jgi:hypothetical protein
MFLGLLDPVLPVPSLADNGAAIGQFNQQFSKVVEPALRSFFVQRLLLVTSRRCNYIGYLNEMLFPGKQEDLHLC